MSKRVLSLDQAACTGFCVLIDGKIVKSGKINATQDGYHHKIRWLQAKIEALVDEYDIEIIIVETPNKGRNQATFGKLSGLYYTTIDLALRKELDYFAYSPSSWRKVLGFKQGAGVKRDELKAQAIAYVNENTELELNSKQDDEGEAVCIGLAYNKQLEK